jgi:hypothetical protein
MSAYRFVVREHEGKKTFGLGVDRKIILKWNIQMDCGKM